MALVLTCDVEDWLQAYTQNCPVTRRVYNNVENTLELLESAGVHATFFVQGMVAEKYPDLVREMSDRGHDVQTHGYSHKKVCTLSPAQFKDELLRCKDIIGSVTGKPVIGFRAPAFSIGPDDTWAYDVLLECGFEYDSSLFPLKTRRYGFRGNTQPFSINRGDGVLFEFPVAVAECSFVRLPAGGGGYMRYLPLAVWKAIWKRVLSKETVRVLYFHPYDINPEDFSGMEEQVTWFIRFTQKIGRSTVKDKIRAVSELAGGNTMTMTQSYLSLTNQARTDIDTQKPNTLPSAEMGTRWCT